MGLFFFFPLSPPVPLALCGIMHFTVFPAMFMTADCNLSVKIQLQGGKKVVFGVRLFFCFFTPILPPLVSASVFSWGWGGGGAVMHAIMQSGVQPLKHS